MIDESKKILIVDDDEEIRNALADVLEMAGFDVFQAHDGQHALDQLLALSEEQLPGLIILDLMMPVMDGSRFLELIETTYRGTLSKIPVVLSSANAHLTSKKIEFAVGILKKPFDIDELVRVVERHWGKPNLR